MVDSRFIIFKAKQGDNSHGSVLIAKLRETAMKICFKAMTYQYMCRSFKINK